MGLKNWLTDLFGVKTNSKKECLEAVQSMVRDRIESEKCSDDMEAKSNQLWEDIQFRERYFVIKRDEEQKSHEFEMRTGKKHSGFFGLRFYPPYTIWHEASAKYINREIADQEWDESPLSHIHLSY